MAASRSEAAVLVTADEQAHFGGKGQSEVSTVRRQELHSDMICALPRRHLPTQVSLVSRDIKLLFGVVEVGNIYDYCAAHHEATVILYRVGVQ